MTLEQELYGFSGFTIAWALLALLVFGGLNLLGISTGSFVAWAIAAAIFWWLITITTVPWNIYFSAQAILAEVKLSRQKQIDIDEQACSYVNKVQRRVLVVAIGLHVLSAIALYLLAATGVSAIGYLGSVAALLLTGLRPTIASYRYLMQRLANIGRELKYPREDIVEVKSAIQELKSELERLLTQQEATALQLNPDEDSSWAARQQRSLAHLRQDVARLTAAHEQFKATNAQDHERIATEARGAIAQLNQDSQFLDQVREIIRFFKSA
ncbi:MAG: hypothetical protein ACFB4J_11340 [Elainellaceae cyanobacterium]